MIMSAQSWQLMCLEVSPSMTYNTEAITRLARDEGRIYGLSQSSLE